jgi:hypothetical protein
MQGIGVRFHGRRIRKLDFLVHHVNICIFFVLELFD